VLNLLYIGNNSDVISTFNDLTSKFKFHQSPNGLKAITFLKEGNKPDAIVCESHLQGMNGIEIGKMIRSITEFVKTPLLYSLVKMTPKLLKQLLRQGQ